MIILKATGKYLYCPHVPTFMATKNISITEEAYVRLASLRRSKESFSEIINRLTNKRRLLDFAGLLSRESAGLIEAHIMKRRTQMDRVRAKRRKTILEQLS